MKTGNPKKRYRKFFLKNQDLLEYEGEIILSLSSQRVKIQPSMGGNVDSEHFGTEK